MKDCSCFLLLFFSLCYFSVSAQNEGDNMTELYHHDVTGQIYNDCWGYVDPDDGREYAIVGTRTHIYFYDITDPENTVLIADFYNGSVTGLSMTATTWRDFKTFGDKAYAAAGSTGSTEGLLVFDLSDLPNSVIFEEQNTNFFNYSHSIFIDTLNGFLYTAGANAQLHGTRIIDLNSDPISLEGGANIASEPLHDIHVRDGLAYCFSGNSGMFVYDFSTSSSSPTYLGEFNGYIGNGYNHSGWLTDSGDHLVFCDENNGLKVKICDVSDPNNIAITDQFNASLPVSGTIAHNPFIKGNYAYVSYYDDGVYVYDISDPTNVTTHAYYDTNPGDGGLGCWGVYPYFPSGSIIATDVNFGFYVMEVNNFPLPVELSRFDALAEEERVKLEWTTASEENSAYFEIQRSTDGVEFEIIGKVDALGRSSEKAEYFTYDEAPFKGDNYYRLKQVDLDGKFEYSEIVSVYFSTAVVEVYPTYINAEQSLKVLFTESADELQFNLYNIQGQLLQSHLLSGTQGEEVQVPTADLQNGTYIVHAFNDTWQVSRRVVVAK